MESIIRELVNHIMNDDLLCDVLLCQLSAMGTSRHHNIAYYPQLILNQSESDFFIFCAIAVREVGISRFRSCKNGDLAHRSKHVRLSVINMCCGLTVVFMNTSSRRYHKLK